MGSRINDPDRPPPLRKANWHIAVSPEISRVCLVIHEIACLFTASRENPLLCGCIPSVCVFRSIVLSILGLGTDSMLQIIVVIRTYTEVEAVLRRLPTEGRNTVESMWYLCWGLLRQVCFKLPSQNVIATWVLIWVSLMTGHFAWFRIMVLNSFLPMYYTSYYS
jgi:hypothetical protein